MHTIAIISRKGGAGKTTIAVIPAGPIGASTRWDSPEDIARRKREAARNAGWEAGYTSTPYPWLERATDIEFAKGYGEGLLAKVEDLNSQEGEDAE